MNKHIKVIHKTTDELFEDAAPNRFLTGVLNFQEAHILNYLKEADLEFSSALYGVEAKQLMLIIDTDQKSMIGEEDQNPSFWIVVPGMDRIYGFLRRKKPGAVQPSVFTMERQFLGYQDCCIAHQKKFIKHYGVRSLHEVRDMGITINENATLCDKHRKDIEAAKAEMLHNRIAGMVDLTGREVRWSELCMQFTAVLMNNGFADLEKTRREARAQMKKVPLKTWG